MSSETFSRERFRGRSGDDRARGQPDPRENILSRARGLDRRASERSSPQHDPSARHRGRAAPVEEHYDDDPERLYESFSDLYEDFDEGRSKTPFVIIGALLAVAIVGGGLAFAYKRGVSDGADGPVIIHADRTAAKVEPVDPGGVTIPHQERRIFDQVTGQEESEGEVALAGEETEPPPEVVAGDTGEPVAVETTEDVAAKPTEVAAEPAEPVAEPTEVAAAPAADEPGATPAATARGEPLTIGRFASNVVSGDLAPLDAPPEVTATSDTSAAAETATASEAAAGVDDSAGEGSGVFEPRRVRTVSIGPDGTVVTGAGASAAAGAEPGTKGLARSAPQAPATESILPSGVEVTPGGAASDTVVAPGPVRDEGLGLTASVGQPATAPPRPADVTPVTQTSRLTPSPRPKPRPTTAAPSAPTQQAAVQQPTDTRPSTPVATAPASNAPLTGYAVQVASHRRQAEAVARFADLQQRYPNLISGLQPLIQRADLGSKGIFFRLRIGPLSSRGEANRLCQSLRNSGLPGCFVRPL